MPVTEEVQRMRGRNMVDSGGNKIGKIEEIYLDTQTEQPEWALVNTGMFGSKSTFVPISGASDSGDDVQVTFDKTKVQDAPNMDTDGELSQKDEAELYRHYGMDYSESNSDTGLPQGGAVGRDTSGPTTDDAMTRSEEELTVGKEKREAGRARLRKYVVTETETHTVPVQREEVRVEREPITDANVGDAKDGPGISEEEHEVVLQQEEAVVGKRTVPKERVRMDKDVVTEEREVTEDVQKEKIEVEGDQRG